MSHVNLKCNIYAKRMLPPRRRLHPNEKPVRLCGALIALHTRDGDRVLDPIMGSGTTGVGALRGGRRFIGIELDRGHFDVACQRIEDAARQGNLLAPAARQTT